MQKRKANKFWERFENYLKATEVQKAPATMLLSEADRFDNRVRPNYVYICDCEGANIAKFGSVPKGKYGRFDEVAYSMVIVKATKEKTCPHCGYYAKLIDEREIGDEGAFGRGLRGKNGVVTKQRFNTGVL